LKTYCRTAGWECFEQRMFASESYRTIRASCHEVLLASPSLRSEHIQFAHKLISDPYNLSEHIISCAFRTRRSISSCGTSSKFLYTINQIISIFHNSYVPWFRWALSTWTLSSCVLLNSFWQTSHIGWWRCSSPFLFSMHKYEVQSNKNLKKDSSLNESLGWSSRSTTVCVAVFFPPRCHWDGVMNIR
jgi:hypothetical protein